MLSSPTGCVCLRPVCLAGRLLGGLVPQPGVQQGVLHLANFSSPPPSLSPNPPPPTRASAHGHFPSSTLSSLIWAHMQIWFKPPTVPRSRRFVAVGRANASLARAKAFALDEEIIRRFLRQLETVFGSMGRVAVHRAYINGVVYRWDTHPNIRGGTRYHPSHPIFASLSWSHYPRFLHHNPSPKRPSSHCSYPVPGSETARATLAQPLYGRVFFAGEAVHQRLPGTLQAAIETGVRAAQEVCDTSARVRGIGRLSRNNTPEAVY
jgi:hypothetical protein